MFSIIIWVHQMLYILLTFSYALARPNRAPLGYVSNEVYIEKFFSKIVLKIKDDFKCYRRIVDSLEPCIDKKSKVLEESSFY